MLTLTRKINDVVFLTIPARTVFEREGRITVKVIDIAEHHIKLGLDAPAVIDIMRGEIENKPRFIPPADGFATVMRQAMKDAPRELQDDVVRLLKLRHITI